MARIIRNEQKWHRLTLRTDRNEGSVVLVKGGKRAYFSAHAEAGHSFVSVTGTKALRRFALAILAEVGRGEGK